MFVHWLGVWLLLQNAREMAPKLSPGIESSLWNLHHGCHCREHTFLGAKLRSGRIWQEFGGRVWWIFGRILFQHVLEDLERFWKNNLDSPSQKIDGNTPSRSVGFWTSRVIIFWFKTKQLAWLLLLWTLVPLEPFYQRNLWIESLGGRPQTFQTAMLAHGYGPKKSEAFQNPQPKWLISIGNHWILSMTPLHFEASSHVIQSLTWIVYKYTSPHFGFPDLQVMLRWDPKLGHFQVEMTSPDRPSLTLLQLQAAKITPTPFVWFDSFLEIVNYVHFSAVLFFFNIHLIYCVYVYKSTNPGSCMDGILETNPFLIVCDGEKWLFNSNRYRV